MPSKDPFVFDADKYIPAIGEAIKADVGMAITDDVAQATVALVLKKLEEMPAFKTAGIISQAGGTADPETKTFADWLLAIARKDVKRLVEVYDTSPGGKWLDATKGDRSIKAALAEGSLTTGGALVPPQFIAELLQLAAEDSIVRPRAYKQTMTSRTTQIPFLDQTTVRAAGVSSFFGGVVANWVGEGAGLTETEPTFRMLELVAHKLAGYTLSSSEALDDSAIGLEQLLKKLFASAIAWYEDYAFLRGDGIGKPLGVQNSPAAISVSRNGGGNNFELVDALAMRKRLPQVSQKNAVWVMHPFTLPDLYAFTVGSATGANWAMDLRGDPTDWKLLGLPIILSEKMAAPGSAFDVALCDFNFYVIGDRKALEIASSEHYKFTNDQMTWRFVYRVDGQPWLNAPITLADGTNTISPFVFLT